MIEVEWAWTNVGRDHEQTLQKLLIHLELVNSYAHTPRLAIAKKKEWKDDVVNSVSP
jgi:hypothetical protein